MNIDKLKRLQSQVRIGGKGTPRRKKKVIHQTAAADDKKLQSSLKKLSVSTIPGIEEVNIIKDDLTVIHFNNPKAQASLSANTFAVTGHGEVRKVVEMLPDILPQLGQKTVVQLRTFANSVTNNQKISGDRIGSNLLDNIDEDDVPLLVKDFDEIAKIENQSKETNIQKTKDNTKALNSLVKTDKKNAKSQNANTAAPQKKIDKEKSLTISQNLKESQLKYSNENIDNAFELKLFLENLPLNEMNSINVDNFAYFNKNTLNTVTTNAKNVETSSQAEFLERNAKNTKYNETPKKSLKPEKANETKNSGAREVISGDQDLVSIKQDESVLDIQSKKLAAAESKYGDDITMLVAANPTDLINLTVEEKVGHTELESSNPAVEATKAFFVGSQTELTVIEAVVSQMQDGNAVPVESPSVCHKEGQETKNVFAAAINDEKKNKDIKKILLTATQPPLSETTVIQDTINEAVSVALKKKSTKEMVNKLPVEILKQSSEVKSKPVANEKAKVATPKLPQKNVAGSKDTPKLRPKPSSPISSTKTTELKKSESVIKLQENVVAAKPVAALSPASQLTTAAQKTASGKPTVTITPNKQVAPKTPKPVTSVVIKQHIQTTPKPGDTPSPHARKPSLSPPKGVSSTKSYVASKFLSSVQPTTAPSPARQQQSNKPVSDGMLKTQPTELQKQ